MKQSTFNLPVFNYPPLWIILAAVLGILYLWAANTFFGYSGFPLDDAWIHQTYARNLGQYGQFAFTPGLPSTGSTSPLWSLLLSFGYAIGIPFKWWAYGLGILLLGLSGFSISRLGQHLFPQKPWVGPVIGLALITEWHLTWAAVSGMETILFIWLSIFLLERYLMIRQSLSLAALFRLGLIGGLLILTRPEGLGLAGLIGIEMAIAGFQERSKEVSPWQQVLNRWIVFGLGLIIPVLPYLVFNYMTTQLILPNTFYAKQQEYGLWIKEQFTTTEAFFFRLRVFTAPFIGMQILLLPGLIKGLTLIWRNKQPIFGLVSVWWLSYGILYAIRLPVTYQHARYQMPVIPWILLLGIWGTAHLIKPRHRRLWPRVLSRAALPVLSAVALLFIFLGIQAYGRDVRIIETEMVATAHWLRSHTQADTIIAAHDIGAIGYFTERPIVDLAGLITPEVIPFIRDEEALLAFSRAKNADFLVTFPSWYPSMTASLTKMYSTNSPWAIEGGSDNMTVYSLR